MTVEKITLQDLDKFQVGEQKMFTLPTYSKAVSAASLARQQKRTDRRMWFTARISDPVEGTTARSVVITRLA
jgi:hypothetical protein